MTRTSAESGYDAPHLARQRANYEPLSPLSFLARAALAYPEKPAVIHGRRRFGYAEFHARCRRLADALRRRGIGIGDTVAIMAPNVPALLEAHYGVPMAGAVLNALNYRLDARSIAFILEHGGAKLVVTDREFSQTMEEALSLVAQRSIAQRSMGHRPIVIDIDDPLYEGGRLLGEMDYEAFLATGDAEAPGPPP